MVFIIFKYFINGIINLPKIFFSIIKHFLIGLYVTITIIPKYFILGIIYIFSKKKKQEILFNNKPVIPLLTIGLSLSIYLLSVFIFSRWYVQNLKIKYLTDDIIASTEIIEKTEETYDSNEDDEENKKDDTSIEENNTNNEDNSNNNYTYYPNDYWDYINVPYLEVNFDTLLQTNPDTVAWIKVEGTKINYPVVQSTDNDYYLHHDYRKNSNMAGWIFGDYRDDFINFKYNTIIYGHNMNNKTMFGSLPDAVLSSSWQNNPNYHLIKISTPTSNSVWKVFSVYTIEPEVYYLKIPSSTESHQEFITTIQNRSIYNFNTEVTINDKILTLSTCDNLGTKRVAVHAKLIKIEEK